MKTLRTGIDLIEVNRVKKALDKWEDHFRKRVFTLEEVDYCNAHKNPYPHYAARFAAKEAVLKALGTGWRVGMRWVDIEVENTESGAPQIRLYNATKEVARTLEIDQISISFSHTRQHAVAQVILSCEAESPSR